MPDNRHQSIRALLDQMTALAQSPAQRDSSGFRELTDEIMALTRVQSIPVPEAPQPIWFEMAGRRIMGL
jgi:hypothetical protein